jgi:hypothetical protein
VSEERLELVTDFGSLRAGDLVVVKDCRFGDGDHCGMLLRFDRGAGGWNSNGRFVEEAAWYTTARGLHTFGGTMLVGASLVATRRLYRVIVPPAADTRETSSSTPKKLERQGVR